jgi:hypothetical protein
VFVRWYLGIYLSRHHNISDTMAGIVSGSVNATGLEGVGHNAVVTNPLIASVNSNENISIIQQVATQERKIAELQQMLQERNQRLEKFQHAKKAEMEAMLTGMREWITNLDLKNENYRADFEKGLQRLVDNSADDNGVWQVMCEASASASKKEEQYQTLKLQYEDLQQKTQGGEYGTSNARSGDKRPALEPPCNSAGATGDMWSQFIADVTVTGYN